MSMSCGQCGGAGGCSRHHTISHVHHRHHEYQFFAEGHHHHHHHGAAESLDHPPPPFHEQAAAGNSSRLTLEVDAGGPHIAHQLQPPAPPTAATVPLYRGAVTITNEPIITIDTKMIVGASHHSTTQDKEAKVMRYREKRTRRRYDKQIRYESRKAYAEFRPRVNGRFVKVPEATVSPSPPASPYDPSKLHLGWFQ